MSGASAATTPGPTPPDPDATDTEARRAPRSLDTEADLHLVAVRANTGDPQHGRKCRTASSRVSPSIRTALAGNVAAAKNGAP